MAAATMPAASPVYLFGNLRNTNRARHINQVLKAGSISLFGSNHAEGVQSTLSSGLPEPLGDERIMGMGAGPRMFNLVDTVRSQCADVDSSLIDMHFRRLPIAYFERFSAAEIGRHLRLLAALEGVHSVDVDLRPLVSHAYEITVVGLDYPGTVACVTTALAANGFDLEDVQVSPYLEPGDVTDARAEPKYFVVVLRVSGALPGRSLAAFTDDLRDRLRLAFSHLMQGNLLEAHAVASGFKLAPAESKPSADNERVSTSVSTRPRGYEGLVLGNDFRLDRKLASGGMSDVYLATQVSLNRTVAVKIFHEHGAADVDLLASIQKEALVLARFSCPHIVQVFAAGTTVDHTGGALAWMAMEYMAGGDLGQWLKEQGNAPVDLALRWFKQALDGLHYAHRQGILHRDLKPHNLLLSADGDLKVSDFGLVKRAPVWNELTPQATIVGTPHYMSPEQALGEPVDERSDIFSLGTTFFCILSGQLPFQGENAMAVLLQISQRNAARLDTIAPHVPAPLAVIIGRMMARRKEERYQEASVMIEDLNSYEHRGLLAPAAGATFTGLPKGVSRNPGDMSTCLYEPAQDRVDKT